MKVSEAAGELLRRTNLETKTYKSQADPLFLQESTEGDWLNHKSELHDDTAEDTIFRGMNQHIHSLLDSKSNSQKELDLCTDKAVIEVSPKLVCFCTEGHHNIKDICVDDGLPTKEECLIGNSETDKKILPNLLHLDVDEDSDSFRGGVKTGESALNDFSVDLKDKQGKDLQFFLPESELIFDDDVDKLVIGGWPGPIKYIACEKLMSNRTTEVSMKANLDKPALADNGEEKQDHHVKSKTQEKITDTHVSIENFSCDSAEEVSPLSRTEAQSSGNLLLNSEPPLPPQIAGKSEEQAIDCKDGRQDDHALPEPVLDQGYVGLSASFRSFVDGSEIRNSITNHAEVSGQPRNSTSASIAYSGPFGSISLRSDSSTASTHSFAFPILPSEWNTSPVKMAEADRRRLRKNRGWRVVLLCCRF